MRVKQLKELLQEYHRDCKGCAEKQDFVNEIMALRATKLNADLQLCQPLPPRSRLETMHPLKIQTYKTRITLSTRLWRTLRNKGFPVLGFASDLCCLEYTFCLITMIFNYLRPIESIEKRADNLVL